MKKPSVFPDLPLTAEKTTRCNSGNRHRKLIIKCGGRWIDCTTNKETIITANTTGGDDLGTGLQSSPLEPIVTSKSVNVASVRSSV
ncbi:hypothetical protein AHAS_Ahas03G0003100 [Arachis hypogaea]